MKTSSRLLLLIVLPSLAITFSLVLAQAPQPAQDAKKDAPANPPTAKAADASGADVKGAKGDAEGAKGEPKGAKAARDLWSLRFKNDAFNDHGIENYRQGTLVSRKLNFNGKPETTMGYSVYLPPGYEKGEQRYPVLYFLHGIGGNENTGWVVVAKAHELMKSGSLPPFIIAAISGGATFYGNHFEGKLQVHDYFINEFIPHIDATYRTKAEKKYRHVQGFSMGGYGTMLFATKHPDMFGGTLDIGGALQGPRYNVWPSMYNSSEDHFRPFDLWVLTEQNRDALRSTKLAIWIGSEDICRRANESFHAHLQKLDLKHEFNDSQSRPKLMGVQHDLAKYYELYGAEILGFHGDAFRS